MMRNTEKISINDLIEKLSEINNYVDHVVEENAIFNERDSQ